MTGIRTERLVLRPVDRADIAAAVAIQGDPRTCRHRPGGPSSPAETSAQLDFWLEHWRTHGFGYWSITLPDDAAVLGFGGLQLGEFDGHRYLNLYYRLRPRAWGHGYAPEMAGAALDWAAAERPDLPVWIITTLDNEPARRVADKLGFTEFRQAEYTGAPCRFYRWHSTPAERTASPGMTEGKRLPRALPAQTREGPA
ncbi:GCN5-related N-acetyltransferase [Actinokineospora spheciospongiae]|uniref:GCN5-related N-acetyltransferase n=1 Tax=Actinokineospora spheciospongiae TaxID=909613 RepID=W7IUL4_9PSEU|nr:GNAT family N-acetyltransferase [Actinokineospora spheciospongiae]EWC60452.1 GCN5-related N-acetyltransferase [Actinokineospora spheciospongiae]